MLAAKFLKTYTSMLQKAHGTEIEDVYFGTKPILNSTNVIFLICISHKLLEDSLHTWSSRIFFFASKLPSNYISSQTFWDIIQFSLECWFQEQYYMGKGNIKLKGKADFLGWYFSAGQWEQIMPWFLSALQASPIGSELWHFLWSKVGHKSCILESISCTEYGTNKGL